MPFPPGKESIVSSSSSSTQVNLPPMGLATPRNKVAAATATYGNSDAVAVADAPAVDFVKVCLLAGSRLGMQDKEMAAIFDLTAPEFSRAFSAAVTDRNRVMKTTLPAPFARECAKVLGELTGLSICGVDDERHAVADLMVSAANYLRVVRR